MIGRRSLLRAAPLLIAAPAIVRASALMPVSSVNIPVDIGDIVRPFAIGDRQIWMVPWGESRPVQGWMLTDLNGQRAFVPVF